MEALLGCVQAAWSPRIGDPTLLGWATVAAYAVTGLLAAGAAWRGASGGTLFWTVAALLMLFLSVNKQLDLQSALTAAGRCLARAQGWYDARRTVQLAFVVGLAVVGVAVLGALVVLMRGSLARNALALLGLAFVMTFVLVRAVGFHHVDVFLRVEVASLRMNSILELGGIALVALNAVWLLCHPLRR
jgi:hypothetical protein